MAVLDFPGVAVLPDNEQEGKLRRDFHPAQLLLVSLNDICPRGPPPKPSDPPPNPNESLEEMFHTFVNKIALICDFEPKGDTITAVAVIWYNAKITYTLASNQRGPGALNNVRKGLTEVLNILKANLEAPSKQPDHVIEERLMDRILWWNKVRVRSYLTTLSKELESCMKRCDINTPEGREAKEALAKLAEVAPDLNKGGQKTETCSLPALSSPSRFLSADCHPTTDIASTIQFIRVIQASRKLKTFLHRYISSRSAEDHTMGKGGSWSNLQHVAGRLLAYRYAVEVLVHAHHMWANTDLFRDFEIEAVRSSIPYLPEAKVLNPTPESVEMILNRMPGPRKKKEALMKDAKVLDEKYYLGIELQRRWKDQFRVKTPPPQKDGQKGTKADATAAVPLKAELELKPTRIVHAEILLHSWLLATEGGVQPARFFQGWQYIVCCPSSISISPSPSLSLSSYHSLSLSIPPNPLSLPTQPFSLPL